ncbi:hypothetical protein GGF37_005932, partial [Kickxella alabastrina]
MQIAIQPALGGDLLSYIANSCIGIRQQLMSEMVQFSKAHQFLPNPDQQIKMYYYNMLQQHLHAVILRFPEDLRVSFYWLLKQQESPSQNEKLWLMILDRQFSARNQTHSSTQASSAVSLSEDYSAWGMPQTDCSDEQASAQHFGELLSVSPGTPHQQQQQIVSASPSSAQFSLPTQPNHSVIQSSQMVGPSYRTQSAQSHHSTKFHQSIQSAKSIHSAQPTQPTQPVCSKFSNSSKQHSPPVLQINQSPAQVVQQPSAAGRPQMSIQQGSQHLNHLVHFIGQNINHQSHGPTNGNIDGDDGGGNSTQESVSRPPLGHQPSLQSWILAMNHMSDIKIKESLVNIGAKCSAGKISQQQMNAFSELAKNFIHERQRRLQQQQQSLQTQQPLSPLQQQQSAQNILQIQRQQAQQAKQRAYQQAQQHAHILQQQQHLQNNQMQMWQWQQQQKQQQQQPAQQIGMMMPSVSQAGMGFTPTTTAAALATETLAYVSTSVSASPAVMAAVTWPVIGSGQIPSAVGSVGDDRMLTEDVCMICFSDEHATPRCLERSNLG